MWLVQWIFGIELGKDCVFHNDQEGLTKLATWMKELPLAAFLQDQGIQVVVVNPHHVNKSKELEDNSPTKAFAELRILMNLREKVSDNLTQVKGRISNWFDRFFPEYASVFKDWSGKVSLMTMRTFPLPTDIVAKGARDVLAYWKAEVKRRAWESKRAEMLYRQ